jgi:hypothetical protein
MTQPSEVALLTPVPLEHLKSGEAVCRREGRVAYGSESGMVLSELAAAATDAECKVLFYASHTAPDGPPRVTWSGRFVGLTGAKAGRHPDHDRLRPPSTDSDGDWLVFYEVADLKQLDSADQLPLHSLKTPKGKKLAGAFIPQGPTLIENPF